jgi:spore germination cell wall hydrolase CwlJ-like protein
MLKRSVVALALLAALTHQQPETVEAVPSTSSLQQLQCLLANAYHEARGEGAAGVTAVVHVTLNRAAKSGEDVCSVVYKPRQFSWTIKDKAKPLTEDTEQLFSTVALAVSADDITGGATHYHHRKSRPVWAKKMKQTLTISNHRFYKEL